MLLEEICRSIIASIQHQANQEHITLAQALDRYLERAKPTLPLETLPNTPIEQLVWNHGVHFSSKQSVTTHVQKIHPDVRDFT